MAVPNNYIDKIKKDGDSRMISPAADMVRVDNDNFEGTDLDEVLDEVAQAIGEAGEGGYAPPAGGIPKTDLSQDVQTSLDKADTALQSFTETDPTVPSWAKQPNPPFIPTKTSDLENDSGYTTNTGTLTEDDFDVSTKQDGTIEMTVGEDTYTINLNHTHEGMAKLVVCEESDLPATLAKDTIYAQVDDAENPTEIETLYIAGLEFAGGGVPAGTPAITRPSGSSINLGENSGSGVSKSIEIKANSHITGDITVGLAANSDLSFDTSNLPSGVTYNSGAGTLTIAQATAILGVNITVVYSGSGAAEIDGGIVIYGGGLSSPKSVVVVVEHWEEIDLSQNNVDAWMGSDGMWSSGNTYGPQASAMIDASGLTKINITANAEKNAIFLFLKSDPTSLFPITGGGKVAYGTYLCNGETDRRVQTADTTETYTIPSDCVKVMIGLISNPAKPGPQFTPQYVGVK